MPSPSEQDVAEIFVGFQEKNRDFLLDFELSFADPRLSESPQRVWDLIRESDGAVSQDVLREAVSGGGDALHLDASDVLDLLRAAGLVRVAGSKRGDPVLVTPIPSILTLPRASSPKQGMRERLRDDLLTLLSRLHASSADFFRPGSAGSGKRLVPESVFAGFLTLGFELLGWDVVREAQRVSGRTDIRLRRNGSREVAIVEIKIWGRHDDRAVQRQVESYWAADTVAGAVVMLTDQDLSEWPETYREQCLAEAPSVAELTVLTDSPVHGLWSSASETADGLTAEVDHFLLRLPRRR